jgi:peptide/nickel transport system permease protein
MSRNWPLTTGLILVALIILVAFLGSWLAPQDPMARTPVLNIGGEWVGPPFPAFSNGFLLGSDRAGRDIFSRLLWAVRPTLAMVTIIAAVRLLLGLLIGLAAGFGTGISQRIAAAATRLALAVPVLVVALATIAFVGIQRGLLAFVLGLSLTGWAETARYVETQTRALRSQPFMEAARSMGAPPAHLVLYHILRHLLPLTAMLLAIEISGTLMATAALGFLGYYIGGGAWLAVEDFVARNTAGMPELGQMLATAVEQVLDPWPMVVVGGVVVLIIFGFSLLGEGLRRQLEGERAGQLQWLHRGLNRAAGWIGGGILPATPAERRRWGLAAAAGAVVLAVVVGAALWIRRTPVGAQSNEFSLALPGGSHWGTQRRDPYGTLVLAASGPLTPTILWSVQPAASFTAGPAVAAEGAVYVAAEDGTVVALDADGRETQRWTVPASPVGSPALAADGTVYVVDEGPGLSALAPDGSTRWRFASEGRRPTSAPIVGLDGTIYFTRVDRVQAVGPDGTERWLSPGVEGSTVEAPPRLSPDGSMIFLGNNIFLAATGEAASLSLPIRDELQFMMPTYATGADGAAYLLAGNNAIRWHIENGQAVAENVIAWDVGGLSIYLPTDSGIAANGNFWIFYGTNFGNSRIAWLNAQSRALANIEVTQSRMRLIGLDDANRAYMCAAAGPPLCLALDVEAKGSIWELTAPAGANVTGGALAPGRLYVTTADGWVHAIGN